MPAAVVDVAFDAGISTRQKTPTRSLLIKFPGFGEQGWAGAVVLSSEAIPVVQADAKGSCRLDFLHDEVAALLTPGTTFTIHYGPSKEIGHGVVVSPVPE